MIRAATPADTNAVVALAVSSGLFPADATDLVETMMSDYFARTRDAGDVCIIDTSEDGDPRGVAYYTPAPATEGTWYVLLLAVDGDRQSKGRGSALMAHIEAALAKRGQRLVLVETSGAPDFARTRHFYEKCGYTLEARVGDYYEPGVDMVLYRKVLTPP